MKAAISSVLFAVHANGTTKARGESLSGTTCSVDSTIEKKYI